MIWAATKSNNQLPIGNGQQANPLMGSPQIANPLGIVYCLLPIDLPLTIIFHGSNQFNSIFV
jgi:hypothetical protein